MPRATRFRHSPMPGGYSRKEIGQGLHWVPNNYCLRRMSFRVSPGSKLSSCDCGSLSQPSVETTC